MRLLAPNQTYYAMPSSIPEITSGPLGVGLIDAIIPLSGMMVTVPNNNAGAKISSPFINTASPTSFFGKWGRTQLYNGTTQYALRSSVPVGLKSLSEITIMLLCAPDGSTGATRFAFAYGSTASTTPHIGIGTGDTSGNFDFRSRDDAGANKSLGAAGLGVSTALYGVGIPSLAIARRSTLLNVLDAYINGTQVDSRAPLSQGAITLNTTCFGGLWRTSFGQAHQGSSFLAATWNRALTLKEIEELSRNPWAIFSTQPRPIILGEAAAAAAFLARQGLNIPQAVNRASTY